MKKILKTMVFVSTLLLAGIFSSTIPTNALSNDVTKISQELVDVVNKAEENIKDTKKKLEESVEEYFAALKTMQIEDFKKALTANTSHNGSYYTQYYSNAKTLMKETINGIYKETINKNNAQKAVLQKITVSEKSLNIQKEKLEILERAEKNLE